MNDPTLQLCRACRRRIARELTRSLLDSIERTAAVIRACRTQQVTASRRDINRRSLQVFRARWS